MNCFEQKFIVKNNITTYLLSEPTGRNPRLAGLWRIQWHSESDQFLRYKELVVLLKTQ